MPLLSELEAGTFDTSGTQIGGFEEKRFRPAPEKTYDRGLLQATWETNNEFGAALNNQTNPYNNFPQGGFNVAKALRERGREADFDKLAWVQNEAMMNAALRQLDRERENREIIAQYPWWQSLPAGVGAGLLSPWTLLPTGGVVKATKGGYSVAMSALTAAGWAGLGAAGQEVALRASQLDRDWQDSAINVGSAVILGGLLGGAGAWFRNALPPTKAAAARGLERMNGEPEPVRVYEHPKLAETWEKAGLPEEDLARFQAAARFKSAEAVAQDIEALRLTSVEGRAAVKEYVDAVELQGQSMAREARPPSQTFDLADIANMGDHEASVKLDDMREAISDALARGDDIKLIRPDGSELRITEPELAVREGRIEISPPINDNMHPTPEFHSVGAAASAGNRIETRDLYTPTGRLANVLSRIGKDFIPALRLAHSPFATAREILYKLTPNNMHLAMEAADMVPAPGGAAADRMKTNYTKWLGNAMTEHRNLYKAMVKDGIQMSQEQFSREVGRAMRRKDLGVNDYVSKAAASWRTKLIEPVAGAAQRVGALPPELEIVGAMSYFPRSHNRDMLIQYRPEFYKRLVPRAKELLDNAFKEQSEELTTKIAKLEQEKQLIGMGREERALNLKLIEGEIEDLNRSSELGMRDRVKEIQAALKTATDPKVISALKDEKQALRDLFERSPKYERYKELKRAKELLTLSEGGQGEKIMGVLDQLERLGEEQYRGLNRLVSQGEKVQQLKSYPDKLEAARKQYDASLKDFRTKLTQQNLRLNQQENALDEEVKRMEDAIQQQLEAKATNMERAAAAPQVQQEELRKFREAAEPIKKRIEAARKRVTETEAKIDRFENRIQAIDDTDPEAMLAALRLNNAEIQQDIANGAMFRGMKAQRVLERLDKYGPEVTQAALAKRDEAIARAKLSFDKKWNTDVISDPAALDKDRARVATEMVDEYYKNISGEKHAQQGIYSQYVWPVAVGPLKGRVNWVQDEWLDAPVGGKPYGFLNDDVTHVLNHYGRTMAGDIGLREVFGEISLEKALNQLTQEYNNVVKEIDRAADRDELKRIIANGTGLSKNLEKAKGQARNFAMVQAESNRRDLEALRNMVLGQYKIQENATTFGRAARSANQIQYLMKMGGVTLSSLTEAIRPAMVHGLKEFVEHIAKPMMTDFEAIRLGVEDLRKFGLVHEMTHMHRIASFAEIGDPMVRGTAVERFLDNAVAVGTRWNGLAAWTDLGQAQAGILSAARILESVTKGNNDEMLRFFNITRQQQGVLKKLFEKHGEIRSGVYISNAHKWLDGLSADEARIAYDAQRAFETALRKDVDSIIVMSSPGDAPLFASTPIGKMILQFRSYNMSAHQKVMLRGLQEHPSRFIGGLTISAIGGAGVAAAQAWRGGEERWKKFKQSAENPGFWIGEGLDRSGIFPLFMDVGNAVDSVARAGGRSFNPIKTPFLWPFPQESQAGDQTRWAIGRGAWGLLGPTAQTVFSDIPRAGGAAAKGLFGEDQLSASEKKAMADIMLYRNYPGMNMFLLWLTDR